MTEEWLDDFETMTLEVLPLARGLTVFLETREGRVSAPFAAAWTDWEIRQQLAEIDSAMSACLTEHFGDGAATATAKNFATNIEGLLREIGRLLFDALVPPDLIPAFESCWRGAVEGSSDDRRGLRIRLRFDPTLTELAPLAALPWETLVRQRRKVTDPPARHRRSPLLRMFGNDRARRPVELDGQLRVLIVESSPSDEHPVEVATDIQTHLTDLRDPGRMGVGLDVEVCREARFENLRDTLIEGRFHALVFLGHGGFVAKENLGALTFVRADGSGHKVPGYLVAENLKDLANLRLVVLMSCSSGALRRGAETPFVNVAPALLREGIPLVAAMQFPISPKAAQTFSHKFLKALRRADPVDVAMVEGRRALFNDRSTRFEWATPALFSQVENPQVFRLPEDPPDALESTAARSPHLPHAADRLHLGIRTFVDGWVQGMPQDPEDLLDLDRFFDPETKHRRILDPGLWAAEIQPRVEEFLRSRVSSQPMVLDLAAHLSIAFWAGRVLEAKAGVDLTVVQRSQAQTRRWRPRQGPVPTHPLWGFESWQRGESDWEQTQSANPVPDRRDVAIAISITHDVLGDVKGHLEHSKTPVSRILHARAQPNPGPTSVASGAHALGLAHQLSLAIQQRSADERRGVLHFFVAAPNVFTLLLGQQSTGFGELKLYEHDFGSGRPGSAGAYQPSLHIVPPRWLGSEDADG